MTATSRYSLPLLEAGQAQKEVSHNEALARLDALLHLVVESRTTPVPTGAGDGAAWIVPTGATGGAGSAGQIAISDPAGWVFVAPPTGCIAFVRDEGVVVVHADGVWKDGWPVGKIVIAGRSLLAGGAPVVVAPVGGTVIDLQARAAVDAVRSALQAHGLLG